MIKTLKTFVVGLQYHNLSDEQIAEIQQGATLTLSRDPYNEHDRHAIEVYLKSRIGFIARKQARIIAPTLDAGASTVSITVDEPSAISARTFSFPVKIEIRANASISTPAPAVAPGVIAGIYRLNLVRIGKTYIGQSGNVNNRLADHWQQLNLGIHTNYKLLEYWLAYGPSAITAELVEAVPPGYTPLHQQQWLSQRERYWIAHERAEGRSINIKDGELFLTTAAIVERNTLLAAARKRTDYLKDPDFLAAARKHTGEIEDSEFLAQVENALDARHQNKGIVKRLDQETAMLLDTLRRSTQRAAARKRSVELEDPEFLAQVEDALDARHQEMGFLKSLDQKIAAHQEILDRKQAITLEFQEIVLASSQLEREQQELELRAQELGNQLNERAGLKGLLFWRSTRNAVENLQRDLENTNQAIDIGRQRCRELDAKRAKLLQELKDLST